MRQRRKWGYLRLPSDDSRQHSRHLQATHLQRTPAHSLRYLGTDDSLMLLCINCDYIVRTCCQSFLVSCQLLTEILHKGLCEECKDVCFLAPGRKLSDQKRGGKVGLRVPAGNLSDDTVQCLVCNAHKLRFWADVSIPLVNIVTQTI